MFLFIGTVHGVIQVTPTVRAWLDSIGSPYGGPGHMIDPLAHAHINIIGGVIMMIMASSYYLIQTISGISVSVKMANHAFWWLTIGITGFYSTLMFFGIWEGMLLLASDTQGMREAHSLYGITISIVSTVMGMGFWIFFANIFITMRKIKKANK